MSNLERLNKLIAQRGYCSRRNADILIKEGKVKVNGKVVTDLGTKFSPSASIEIDNKVLTKEEKVYYMLYKPLRTLSSVTDDRDRVTVVDLIQSDERIFPVGRLDYNTSGLLLLTNDGEFSNLMTHPRYEMDKIYEVTVKGIVDTESIRKLEHGVMLDNRVTAKAKVKIKFKDFNKQLTSFEIKIHEGRNRQVRRMCEEVGFEVTRLHRKQFSFLTLGSLKPQEYRELKPFEVKKLINLATHGE